MGYHRDFEELTPTSQLKLRASEIASQIGSILTDKYKKHPSLLSPYLIPIPLIPTTLLATLAAGTIAYESRSKAFRSKFMSAATKPLNLKFHEQAVKACPKSGQAYACSVTLLKKHWRGVKNSLSFLGEYHLSRLPQNSITGFAKWAHTKITRYPFPALVDEERADSKMSGRWKSAAFALASLANMEPLDIAAHLAPHDRRLFEQEYATQEL